MSKNGISNIWGAFWGVCGGFRTKLNTFRSAHMNLGQMLSLVRQLFGSMQNPHCGRLLQKSQYFGGLFGGPWGFSDQTKDILLGPRAFRTNVLTCAPTFRFCAPNPKNGGLSSPN